MVEEQSEIMSTSDSRSLIQLLQNNKEVTERYNRRKKWISPSGIAIVILYGIVIAAIFIFLQMLREYQNDMKNDVKKLQDDVINLKIQNQYLKTKLHMSMNAKRNQSAFNDDKHARSKKIQVNKISIESSRWNESAFMEHINNATQKLESQFILAQNQLNASLNAREKKVELQVFDRLYEKMIQEISKKSMNQSIQELLMKGTNESSLSLEQNFIAFQELIFKTFGGNKKESRIMLKSIKNNLIKDLRSCNDYKRLGMTENGFYEINLGNPPSNFSSVRVFCDFTSNSTYLYHNSIEGANVTDCEGDSCFQHNLTYSASLEQIKILIGNSRHCQQSIRFRCFHAFLKNYGTWYDSSGEKQIYFTGSNYGEHLCQCYNSTDGCSGLPSVNKCNCDASLLPVWLEDVGNITNKTALPISKFTYGHLHSGGEQKAFIQVGPLNCSGEAEVKEKSYLSNEDEGRIMAKWDGYYMETHGILHENGYLEIMTAGYYLIYCSVDSVNWICLHTNDFDTNLKYFASGHHIDVTLVNDIDSKFAMYLIMEDKNYIDHFDNLI